MSEGQEGTSLVVFVFFGLIFHRSARVRRAGLAFATQALSICFACWYETRGRRGYIAPV